jgi:hypothetical protein
MERDNDFTCKDTVEQTDGEQGPDQHSKLEQLVELEKMKSPRHALQPQQRRCRLTLKRRKEPPRDSRKDTDHLPSCRTYMKTSARLRTRISRQLRTRIWLPLLPHSAVTHSEPTDGTRPERKKKTRNTFRIQHSGSMKEKRKPNKLSRTVESGCLDRGPIASSSLRRMRLHFSQRRRCNGIQDLPVRENRTAGSAHDDTRGLSGFFPPWKDSGDYRNLSSDSKGPSIMAYGRRCCHQAWQ